MSSPWSPSEPEVTSLALLSHGPGPRMLGTAQTPPSLPRGSGAEPPPPTVKGPGRGPLLWAAKHTGSPPHRTSKGPYDSLPGDTLWREVSPAPERQLSVRWPRAGCQGGKAPAGLSPAHTLTCVHAWQRVLFGTQAISGRGQGW